MGAHLSLRLERKQVVSGGTRSLTGGKTVLLFKKKKILFKEELSANEYRGTSLAGYVWDAITRGRFQTCVEVITGLSRRGKETDVSTLGRRESSAIFLAEKKSIRKLGPGMQLVPAWPGGGGVRVGGGVGGEERFLRRKIKALGPAEGRGALFCFVIRVIVFWSRQWA